MIQPLVTKNWWRRPTIIRYVSDSKEIQQDNRRSNYEHNAAFIGAENKTTVMSEYNCSCFCVLLYFNSDFYFLNKSNICAFQIRMT